MVFAFIVLSLAMIVGGVAAVVLGWDIVLVERGWTMVIAGSVFAGSGAVLLGIAGAVGRLGRIRSQLVSLGEELSRVAAPPPPPPIMADPTAAVSSSLLGGGAAGPSSVEVGDHTEDARPDLPPFLRPARDTESVTGKPEESVPRQTPAGESDPDRLREGDGERVGDVEARRDGIKSPGDEARSDLGPHDEAPLPPFEHEDQADRAPSPAEEMDVPVAEQPPDSEPDREPEPDVDQQPTVIGTYNSGDNRYVMFSDGSIEAETPDGVFRFTSLDELKEFIASGGEGGARAS